MKTRSNLVFAMSGAMAGMLLLVLAKVIPLLLVFGVGPAIIGACVLALATEEVPIPKVRTVAAVLLSVPAYLAAFGCFAATASFVQRHGGVPSTLLSDLGPDIVLGLMAAVTVAGVLLELLAFLLSGRWSTASALGLVCGGMASVGCAYLTKVVYFHLAGPPEGVAQLAVLFGPLFVVGGAITATIIGEQIRKYAKPRDRFAEP